MPYIPEIFSTIKKLHLPIILVVLSKILSKHCEPFKIKTPTI